MMAGSRPVPVASESCVLPGLRDHPARNGKPRSVRDGVPGRSTAPDQVSTDSCVSGEYLRLRDHGWPPLAGMTLEENLADLRRHADDFTRRAGFTFTILDPATDDVIGCLYLYPSASKEWDVTVQSWVRANKVGPRRAARRRGRALARHRLALEEGGPPRPLSRGTGPFYRQRVSG
jgi:hypothetical protein